MAEEKVDRIILDVSAPADKLRSSESGLNYALRKLGAISSMLDRIDRQYQKIASMRIGGGGSAGSSMGPLFNQFKKGIEDAAKTATVTGVTLQGKVNLEVPGYAVQASLLPGSLIKLQIDASSIVAEVKGQVVAKGGGGTGGGSGGGAGGSAAGGAGDPAGAIMAIKTVTNAAGETILREIKQAQDRFGQVVRTVQNRGGNITTTTNDKIAQGALSGANEAKNIARADIYENLSQKIKASGGDRLQMMKAEAEAWDALSGRIASVVKGYEGNLVVGGKGLELSKLQAEANQVLYQSMVKNANVRRATERKDLYSLYGQEVNMSRSSLTADIGKSNGNAAMVRAAQQAHQARLASAAGVVGSLTGDAGLQSEFATLQSKAMVKAAMDGAAVQKQTQQDLQRNQQSFERTRQSNARADQKAYTAELKQAMGDQSLDIMNQKAKALNDLRKQKNPANRVANFQAQAGMHRDLGIMYRNQAANALNPNQQAGFNLKAEQHMGRAAEMAVKASIAQDKLSESTRHVGKNMLQNVVHVGQWAASVGVLYTGLGLVNRAMGTLIDTSYQMARLRQVFRGAPEEVQKLYTEVLGLAAALGREKTEAMEAAIAWSRLGMSRMDTLEAVRVSLMAANVAEISAGEATEHLSSLMQVYGLRAYELSSALGMLNSISNTYNATNKDMLTGLTRTSAIARQAGMSLAETMGIIGASVGKTGQTGPNMANALKSMLGSLNAGDKQQMLREDFNIEFTIDGGESVKNMSDFLAELWVNYEKMNKAERQSMLFNTYGKQQASRVAAILDSYVKAQVLAIAAQNNLNSAESENVLIMESLKFQLQAVATEWDKFTAIQGGRTVAPFLKEFAQFFHNILAAMNAPGINQIMTGIIALIGAMGAKMALTAFSMQDFGKKGGVVTNTVRAMKVAMGELKSVMLASGANPGKMAQMFGLGGTAAAGGLRTNITRDAAGKTTGVKIATEGLTGMAKAGMVARIALIGLADVALPLLALYAVIKLIDKTVESLGFSSTQAESKIEALVRASEVAGKSGEGAGMAARLFKTVGEGYQASRTKSGAKSILETAAEAAFMDQPVEQQKAMQEELKKNFRLWVDTNNQAAINAKLTELSATAEKHKFSKRQEQFELLRKQDQKYEQEINRLKAKPFDHSEEIQGFESRRSALRDQRTTYIVQDSEAAANALDEFAASSVRLQTILKAQNAIADEVMQTMRMLPGNSQTANFDKEILANEIVNRNLAAQIKLVQEKRKGLNMGDMTVDEMSSRITTARSTIAARREAAEREFAATELKNTIFNEAGGAQVIETDEYQQAAVRRRQQEAKLKQAEADVAAMEDMVASVNSNEGAKGLDAQLKGLNKAKRESDAVLNAMKNDPERRRFTEMQDRINIGTRFANAQAEAFGFGSNDAAKMVNRVAELQKSVARPANTEMEKITQLAHQAKLQEELIQGELRLIELRKDEKQAIIDANKEFQKSLLTSSPGELLRKLAVNRVTGGGRNQVGSGQFFAMSEGARGDYMQTPAGSPNVANIRQEIASLMGGGFGNQQGAMDKVMELIRGQKGLMDNLGIEINANARDAALNLGNLAAATDTLIASFGAAEERLNAFLNLPNFKAPVNAQEPAQGGAKQ